MREDARQHRAAHRRAGDVNGVDRGVGRQGEEGDAGVGLFQTGGPWLMPPSGKMPTRSPSSGPRWPVAPGPCRGRRGRRDGPQSPEKPRQARVVVELLRHQKANRSHPPARGREVVVLPEHDRVGGAAVVADDECPAILREGAPRPSAVRRVSPYPPEQPAHEPLADVQQPNDRPAGLRNIRQPTATRAAKAYRLRARIAERSEVIDGGGRAGNGRVGEQAG